jgi:hypothetical protein
MTEHTKTNEDSMKSVELITVNANRLEDGSWVAGVTFRMRDRYTREGYPVIKSMSATTFRDIEQQIDKKLDELKGGRR